MDIAKYDDAYFKHDKKTKEQLAEKPVVTAERVADQKQVDVQLLNVIKKTPLLKAYLNAHFAFSKGQYPHSMKF